MVIDYGNGSRREVDHVTARTMDDAMKQAVAFYGRYLDAGQRITVVMDPKSAITAWDRILDDDLGIP